MLKTISLLMKDVLNAKPMNAPSGSTGDSSDSIIPTHLQALRIELLQLGTLLLQHMSEAFVEHRKELIKR